jgi:N-acetyl sugar amidotransferase
MSALNHPMTRITGLSRHDLKDSDYEICSRCIMDTSDPEIVFDVNGICNHCQAYDLRAATELPSEGIGKAKLERLTAQIQRDGRGKAYDCVIGVSGGVDSTMVAYTVKNLGLRPLAVHLDNGWDSELAVQNIERTLERLEIELFTYVIDWEEFKDLQLSFFKASVANVEALTDHAINAVLFKAAAKHGIKFVITGGNLATEAVMPGSWMYDARDLRHIVAIQKRFGSKPILSFPHCSVVEYFYYAFFKQIKYVPILNYILYVKSEAKELIERELGWRDYGGKHYESIFTRFFQAYYLPIKFKMDKRRPHLSTMILSGQVTRHAALAEMEKELYPPELFNQDFEFFLKKMELTSDEFDRIMKLPLKTYKDYPSNAWIFAENPWIIQTIKKIVKPTSLK